jgi:peptide/nickel transport system permease protein
MALLIFAIRRAASAIFVMFLVSILTFLIFFAIPNGNPALRLAGRTATPQTIAIVTKAYGFNKPIWVQYYRTMRQILNGTIQSYTQHVSVWSQIRRGFPATFSLAVGGAVLWLLIGIVLGVVGALRAGKVTDVAITVLSFIGISAPPFVVGSLLLTLLTFRTQLLPAGGFVPLTSSPLEWFTHLILPWFTLAILYIGIYAQVLRSSVLDAMTTDAVRTANAKGLSQRRVLIKHVLRVSLIPIVSLWGLDFAAVVGGAAIIVEVVFNLNGIGEFAANSIGQLDVPSVLVVTLLGSFFVVLMNVIVDVLYAVLDPRLGHASS